VTSIRGSRDPSSIALRGGREVQNARMPETDTRNEPGHVHEGLHFLKAAVHLFLGLLTNCTMTLGLEGLPDEVTPSTNKLLLKTYMSRSHTGNHSGKWLSLSMMEHFTRLPFLTELHSARALACRQPQMSCWCSHYRRTNGYSFPSLSIRLVCYV
jgi:hypothetical protein